MPNAASALRTPSRTIVLAAGAFTAMGTGAIYMWSIFNKPLMAQFGYSASEVSLVYSLFMFMSLVGSIIAGWLQNRMASRWIVLGSGILFGLGWFLTGFADNLAMLYLCFSGMAGLGNGFLYNTIVAVVIKWFPDRRGFANGICIGAIGMSSIIFAPLGNFLIESFDVQMAFHIVGVIWLVIYLVFSNLLQTPPPDWTPGGKAAGAQETAEASDSTTSRQVNYTAGQMVRTPLFYCLFLMYMTAVTSGLMITGHASNIGQELAGLTASEGAIMVAVLAVGSTVGRFGFGSASDYIGRFNTLVIALGLNALVMFLIMPQATSFIPFLASVCVVGACFGGILTVVPAIVGDAFGSANFGQNYSFVYAGYTTASFIGPLAAATAIETAGSYLPAFAAAGILSLASIALVFACKHFYKKLG
ncbi:MAG: OFA family MFS transporter [Coriobacteriia bacterium]|nr:OFA family MFS transporter [Coriobacteriia bacterium]